MKDVTCQQCGKAFRVRDREAGKYCSPACYHAYERIHGRLANVVPRVQMTCKTCGGTFERGPGKLRAYRKKYGRDPLYCSIPCSAVGRKADTDARRAATACATCGEPVTYKRKVGAHHHYVRQYCSRECRIAGKVKTFHERRPDRPIRRRLNRHGYVVLWIPGNGETVGREILEHRYVMERALGRPLRPDETIHHRNGKRDDNRIDNIDLRSGNHGPGGDVAAMIRWAHDFIAAYPQFDREGNFTPVAIAPEIHQSPIASS